MLRGVSFELQPYICEDDQESAVQTVFWIKPMTGHDANHLLSRYSEARQEGRQGQVKLKVGRLDSADETGFVKVVQEIENYEFGDKFPDKKKDGMIAKITSEDEIRMVAQDIAPTYFTEIMEAANKISSITEPERKESSSSSTSSTGGQKKESEPDSTTAKPAK